MLSPPCAKPSDDPRMSAIFGVSVSRGEPSIHYGHVYKKLISLLFLAVALITEFAHPALTRRLAVG